jgi:glycerol-3-phosphate dehydrogenase
MRLGLSRQEALRIATRYGSNVGLVYQYIVAGNALEHQLSHEVYGSLLYGIEREMVVSPADFFVRRTGDAFFSMDQVRKWKDPVVRCMQDYFNWDKAQLGEHVRRIERELSQFGL